MYERFVHRTVVPNHIKSLEDYLASAVRNTIRDIIRKSNAKKRNPPNGRLDLTTLDQKADRRAALPFDADDFLDKAQEFSKNLDDLDREIFLAFTIKKMNVSEIAESSDCTKMVVSKRIFRLNRHFLEFLRDTFGPLLDG